MSSTPLVKDKPAKKLTLAEIANREHLTRTLSPEAQKLRSYILMDEDGNEGTKG